jgi:replicative DNA helicase
LKELNGVPYDKEAETELVCSLLAGPDYLCRIASEIQPKFFFNPELRTVYTRMLSLVQHDRDVTEINMGDGTDQEFRILLCKLYDNSITGTSAPHWAKKVREHAYAREIYKLGEQLKEQACKFLDFDDADTFLRNRVELTTQEFSVADNDTYAPSEIVDICTQIEAKRENPGIHGVKTLFHIFDRVVKGLKLINLVAAPSGFGKTAMGLQWAWNIGVIQKIPILYMNYEMGEDELIERLLACGSGVPLDSIQLGETTDAEVKKIQKAKKQLAEGQLFVTGGEEKTIDNTINLMHQYAGQHGIRVVVVDYIGEIGKKEEEYDRNTYALYGDWLQRIKNAGIKLNIKAVVLAQLNRDGYVGAPGMQHLADSLQLIHKSHVVVALYLAKDGQPYMKFLKNRGGPIVVPIRLNYEKSCQRLSEYEPF